MQLQSDNDNRDGSWFSIILIMHNICSHADYTQAEYVTYAQTEEQLTTLTVK